MLELPESFSIAGQVGEFLKGKVIAAVEIEQSPHKFAFFTDDKDKYADMLAGETIRGGASHGGYAEIVTDQYVVNFSDGAYPRYFAPGEKPPAKRQFMLEFADGSRLAVCIQMYGFIGVARIGAPENQYRRAAVEKPDPLGDGFTYDYFKSLYEPGGKKLSAKAFLATEQRIPGLGNGVLQDILFNAKIDPRRAVNTLSEEDWRALYASVRSTLKEMRDLGGRSTERDLFGKPGGYPCRLCKDTLGSPCPRCGTPIEKAAYLGGAVYFCAECQR